MNYSVIKDFAVQDSSIQDSAILHFSVVQDSAIQAAAVLNSSDVQDSDIPASVDLDYELPEFLVLKEKLVDAKEPRGTVNLSFLSVKPCASPTNQGSPSTHLGRTSAKQLHSNLLIFLHSSHCVLAPCLRMSNASTCPLNLLSVGRLLRMVNANLPPSTHPPPVPPCYPP